MTTYKIIRFFAPHLNRKDKAVLGMTGLTLQEAQAHCNDPKSAKQGEWFDGYTAEG